MLKCSTRQAQARLNNVMPSDGPALLYSDSTGVTASLTPTVLKCSKLVDSRAQARLNNVTFSDRPA